MMHIKCVGLINTEQIKELQGYNYNAVDFNYKQEEYIKLIEICKCDLNFREGSWLTPEEQINYDEIYGYMDEIND